MRSIRIISFYLSVLAAVAAHPQEAEPFHARNLSPPVAIFGLPTWQTVTDRRVLTATAEVANHYRLSRRGSEWLILDGETLRMNLFYSRPLGERWAVSAELPVLQQTGGVLDNVVDGWHSAFGLPDGGRNNRPEDQLLFQMASDDELFYMLDDDRRGIGDLQLALARRFGADGRFVARAAVKLPTGRESMLAGSGSRDWSITFVRPREGLLGGRAAGYYWGVGWLGLGDAGRIAFPAKEGAVLGLLGGAIKVLPRIGVKAQIDVYSAMYETALEELGEDAVQATFGGWWEMSESTRLELAVAEDLHVSTAPDVVLHLSLRWSW